MIETFTSRTLPKQSRTDAWNAIYSQHLNRVTFTPADRLGFTARLSLGGLGPIQFAAMSAQQSHIERTRRDIIPGAPRTYSFILQNRSSSVLTHCGEEARLAAGDIVLCDSNAPHRFTLEDESEIVMLRVGAPLLRKSRRVTSRKRGRRSGGLEPAGP